MNMIFIEELQIGINENAKVYKINDKTGEAVYDASLVPLLKKDIPTRTAYRNLIKKFQ